MSNRFGSVAHMNQTAILETNNVIKNTYLLLGASFVFSAIMAGVAMAINAPSLGLITLALYFGILFWIQAAQNSVWGVVGVFALTGTMGFTLGPLLNAYLYTYANGLELILTALGGTGLIFFALSAYALKTRTNFNYLAGFLMSGALVLLFAMVIQIFFPMPMLQLALSAGFILFSAGIILFETSQLIHGGQRNYVLATVQIFVALYNLFISLLHILSIFAGRRD